MNEKDINSRQVDEAINIFISIRDKSIEIELLKKQIKQLRDNSLESIVNYLKSLPINELTRKCSILYWSTEEMAGKLREAFYKITTGPFLIEPKTFIAKCVHCNKEYYISFKHWQSKKDHKKRNPCQQCQKEKEKQEELYDKKWEEIRQQQNKIEEDSLNNLKNLPYKEYLQTDHWKNTRKKALYKANYRCQLCNDNKNLHVHHRTYENLGQETTQDLTVLCKPCHEKHHGIIP